MAIQKQNFVYKGLKIREPDAWDPLGPFNYEIPAQEIAVPNFLGEYYLTPEGEIHVVVHPTDHEERYSVALIIPRRNANIGSIDKLVEGTTIKVTFSDYFNYSGDGRVVLNKGMIGLCLPNYFKRAVAKFSEGDEILYEN